MQIYVVFLPFQKFLKVIIKIRVTLSTLPFQSFNMFFSIWRRADDAYIMGEIYTL